MAQQLVKSRNCLKYQGIKDSQQEIMNENVQPFVSFDMIRLGKIHTLQIALNQKRVNNFSCQLSAIKDGNRKIKPKMIKKVISWMKRVSIQTMDFQFFTFQLSVRILAQYLSKIDEPVDSLQLLACACIYLASKIAQKQIIASQSYEACAMNIFDKNELQKKENEVFRALNYCTNIPTFLQIYLIIDHSLQFSNEEQTNIMEFLLDELQNIDFLELNPVQFLANILKELKKEPMSISQNQLSQLLPKFSKN